MIGRYLKNDSGQDQANKCKHLWNKIYEMEGHPVKDKQEFKNDLKMKPPNTRNDPITTGRLRNWVLICPGHKL